jgi:ring-1,2-phenylacetyl-CoA epoxidase subunit PaaE
MTNKLIEDLNYLGIVRENINRELFVITTITKENETQKAQVIAKVNGKKYQFETHGGKSILQSAIAQNIPLSYSCQSGLCGMCKMKCTEGKVIMQSNQVLSEKELNDGYILTCQSLPQTKIIVIKNP